MALRSLNVASAKEFALLDARAEEIGLRIGWETHFRAGPDPEWVGLTAGANHIFIYGPARLDGRALPEINSILDALLRRERQIVEDQHGNPRLM